MSLVDNRKKFTFGRKLLSLLEGYYSTYLWARDHVAPQEGSSIIDALKVAGYVKTISAIIDNMRSSPRRTKVRKACRSFELKGSDTGILFTHGFGANPEIFRDLAEYLNKETGFTCRVLRLEGHGTSVQDMERTTFLDWYKSVELHYKELSSKTKEIILLGHSMGSTLSLLFSVYNPCKAVITISPPLDLPRPDAKFLPLITWIKRYWPTKESEAVKYRKRGHYIYPKRPLKCVTSMFDLMSVTRKRLHKVTAPLYTSVGLKDPRVPSNNIELLLSSVSSSIKRADYFSQSTHSIHLGPEKDEIKGNILKFIREL